MLMRHSLPQRFDKAKVRREPSSSRETNWQDWQGSEAQELIEIGGETAVSQLFLPFQFCDSVIFPTHPRQSHVLCGFLIGRQLAGRNVNVPFHVTCYNSSNIKIQN